METQNQIQKILIATNIMTKNPFRMLNPSNPKKNLNLGWRYVFLEKNLDH